MRLVIAVADDKTDIAVVEKLAKHQLDLRQNGNGQKLVNTKCDKTTLSKVKILHNLSMAKHHRFTTTRAAHNNDKNVNYSN